MEYSTNFGFALPSRDNDVDLADINEISNNFRKIDENAVKKEEGKGLSTNDFTDEQKEKIENSLRTAEALEEQVNKILGNQKETTFKVEVANANQAFNLRNLCAYDNGITKIDYGDGAVETSPSQSMNAHYYAEVGTYKCKVYGLTILGYNILNQYDFVKEVEIGSIVTEINHRCFFNCTGIEKVTIYAIEPPTMLYVNASGTAQTPAQTPFYTNNTEMKVFVLEKSILKYMDDWSKYASYIKSLGYDTTIYNNMVVTVGANGDFATINKALEHLSAFYPTYKKGGLSVKIKILSGTVITEQIFVERIDLSYITITSEDAEVSVDTTGWKGITHDSRGDAPFFSGEYAAKLPCIGTVFKRIAGDTTPTVGYFANRGSSGVVLPACGFDGFYDNVIANNESSIAIREGVSKNATRWGVHARHNGEVSARSCDLTGCGTGACADRVADLDIREAIIDNCVVAIQGLNCSRVNANGTNIANAGTTNGEYIIQADGGSMVNCVGIKITNPLSNIYSIATGGMIMAHNDVLINVADKITVTNVATNILTSNGVILE